MGSEIAPAPPVPSKELSSVSTSVTGRPVENLVMPLSLLEQQGKVGGCVHSAGAGAFLAGAAVSDEGAAPAGGCCAAASIGPASATAAAVLTRRNVRARRGAGSVMGYPSQACGPCTARLGNRSGSGVWLIAGLRAALFAVAMRA